MTEQKDKSAPERAIIDAMQYGTGIYTIDANGSTKYVSHAELFECVDPPKVCASPLAKRPVLYTDTVGGNQAMRDDLWAISTYELNQAAQDALDAARYRWLRDPRNSDAEHVVGSSGGDKLDEVIDAAIAAEKAAS